MIFYINPTKVPKKEPKASEKVLPYPAVTLASEFPGKRAKTSSK